MLEFKTTINGQRVYIEIDKIISGQSEFSMSVGDLSITDSFKDDKSELIQAMQLISSLLGAGFDRYNGGLEYLYSFLEAFDKLNSEH